MQTRNRPPSRQAIALLSTLASRPAEWCYGLELSAATGLKSGTLYPILIRLAERGLLESRWQPSEHPGRPPRHAYRITATGRAALAATPAPAPRIKEAFA